MKKQIIFTSLGILLLVNLVSATTIIAGNQEIMLLEVNPSSCKIIDSQNNSLLNYSLDGLNFTIDGNKVIINTHPALKPDNYTLICNYSWTEETEDHYPRGGSSCIYNKTFDWDCSEWNECVDGGVFVCSTSLDGYLYQTSRPAPEIRPPFRA